MICWEIHDVVNKLSFDQRYVHSFKCSKSSCYFFNFIIAYFIIDQWFMLWSCVPYLWCWIIKVKLANVLRNFSQKDWIDEISEFGFNFLALTLRERLVNRDLFLIE
ncbi:hypothetical protein A9970_05220 [Sphingobacterium sp. UME9]|nr:hypothetical protein [Sphingobacterium sp. UME9]